MFEMFLHKAYDISLPEITWTEFNEDSYSQSPVVILS